MAGLLIISLPLLRSGQPNFIVYILIVIFHYSPHGLGAYDLALVWSLPPFSPMEHITHSAE
jgi:hypothetical protein